MKKKTSVLEYERMELSKEWFPNYLRVYMEWDDSKYIEMMRNIRTVLSDYSDSDFFPKSVRYFFTSEVDRIVGTVSNEMFLNSPPKGLTREDFELLLEKRKSELLDIKNEFFYGEI